MRGLARSALVLAGYVVAVVAASAAVAWRIAHTSGPDAQASAGMYAFGDSMLFLIVFGALAAVPTAMAFYFLRTSRWFWGLLAVLALAIAATALAAVGALVLEKLAPRRGPLEMAAALGVLRVLVAPLLAGAFALGALFAPTRLPRRGLLLAALFEGAAALYAALAFFLPARLS